MFQNKGKRLQQESKRNKRNSKKTTANEPRSKKEMRDFKKYKKLSKLTQKQIKRRKLIKKIILIVFIFAIILLGIYIGVRANTWKMLATDMCIIENSIVKDKEGETIATLGNEKNNETITFEKIPKNLKNAYVSIEDERFYEHIGVDLKRTGAAIGSYIIHFGSSSYGGSTITQQLVKNLTGDSTDSITRKITEWWKAWQLETCMSKDEILEAYLNIIYVGPNIYGVETGAQYYFDKSVTELSLAECAFLAGINHSPNSYNPFGEVDATKKIESRTKTVLAKMKELKYITENEYNESIKEVEDGLDFQKGKFEKNDEIYSYHTDALIPEIIEDISNKYKISETFAQNYIEKAGLTIYSTQDSEIQDETEIECSKSKYILKSKNGKDTSQAAMVVMDHKTGQVLACVGGLGEKTESRTYNRATQSLRQTGSAMKPLALLAPCISKRIITASTIFDDTEQDFKDGYHPVDYSSPLGKITVRRAVESSQNVPFVQMMEKLTPATSIDYLKKFGITSLTEKDNDLPLALGGLEKGITPLEMAGGYATIANDGVYIEPTFYTKIERKNKEVLIETSQESRRVISKEEAYIVKELLTQPVLGENGTATYCKISGVDVAAKTGTTDENYDRWLCGFTPYYTAVTWFGYDKNETVEFNKRNPAGLIWANVMTRIHVGLQSAKFEKPDSIDVAYICAETGKRATTGCSNYYKEYFLWFTLPELCDKHSGKEIEYKEESNTTNNNTVKEITTDIDEEEPQRTTQVKTENNNTQTNNTNKTNENNTVKNNATYQNTNTNSNVNSTNSNTNINYTNTEQNTNTNTNINTNITNDTNTSTNTSTENNTNSNTTTEEVIE